MLYVQQSLGSHEEIVRGARFHWMYTLNALMCIFSAALIAVGVLYALIWWDVSHQIEGIYGNIPDYLQPVAWQTIVATRGGYMSMIMGMHVGIRLGIVVILLLGVLLFLHRMLIRATTEIAVTNERLIYKKGLIARHVGELDIDRIEGVSVYQGVWGRIFGYGNVCIRGMGVGEVMLPPIADPVEFRRAVNEAKGSLLRNSQRRDNDLL